MTNETKSTTERGSKINIKFIYNADQGRCRLACESYEDAEGEGRIQLPVLVLDCF